MRSSSWLPSRILLPSSSGDETVPSLQNGRSISVIIHGVGNISNRALLDAVDEGYGSSGLAGSSKQLTLTDCPTLSGQKGAESLVINTSEGSHFVVALSWAERRMRLSAIAQWTAVLLLVLTTLLSLAFLFLNQLEWLENWFQSWPHRVLGYCILTVLSYLFHALNPNSDNTEFKRPSMFYLLMPPLLLMGLMLFVGFSELFWVPVAMLILAIWIMATLIVLRCLRVAPTLGWKAALIALVVAMTLPSLAIVRIAMQWTSKAEQAYPSPGSPHRHVWSESPSWVSFGPVLGTQPTNPSASPDKPEKAVIGKTSDAKLTQKKATPTPKQSKDTKQPSSEDEDDMYNWDQGPSSGNPRSDMEHAKSLLNTPVKHGDLIENKWFMIDDVSGREFIVKIGVAAICVFLCVLAMAFNWSLDLGFDVLYYGGYEKHRNFLNDATIETIQWLHEQAPCTRIIVVGHSLGSVIAARAVSSLCENERWFDNLTLVTLGSPLNYLSRVFSSSVPSAEWLSKVICGRVRWINLWRSHDLIGKGLQIGKSNTVQYCVSKGGHANYWRDGIVWKQVAQDALQMGNEPESTLEHVVEKCVFERRLNVLVSAAILTLGLSGAMLWYLESLLAKQ
ncbi:MAG: hypothetical protein JWQ87_5292 [Candidatus Sulfotelmatobacter sp.]|nr:hypothetical protein [Candidatus Sulfotelmatobacter sp.]